MAEFDSVHEFTEGRAALGRALNAAQRIDLGLQRLVRFRRRIHLALQAKVGAASPSRGAVRCVPTA